eukprot:m.458042 g.458042  ORF g.458042 m.458042 type:complete len:632 (+) comp21411_c0_seq1:91-1986(+)
MSFECVVQLPHGQRVTVKAPPPTLLVKILESACEQSWKKIDVELFTLRRPTHRKPVDLNSSLQYSGFPNVVQLEVIEADVRRVDKPVKVAVQLQGHPRVVAEFGSRTTLWQILRQFDSVDQSGTLRLTSRYEPQSPTASGDSDATEHKQPRMGDRLFLLPACRYLRREIATLEELRTTTLDDLGAVGKAMISVRHTQTTLTESEVDVGEEESSALEVITEPGAADSAGAPVALPAAAATATATPPPRTDPVEPVVVAAGDTTPSPESAPAATVPPPSGVTPMAVDVPVLVLGAEQTPPPTRTSQPAPFGDEAAEPAIPAQGVQKSAAPPVVLDEAVVNKVRAEWAAAQRCAEAKRTRVAHKLAADKLAAEQAYQRHAAEKAAAKATANSAAAAAAGAQSESGAAGPVQPRQEVAAPPRDLTVFLRPDGPIAGWEVATEGEGFFDVTPREFRQLMGEVKRAQQPAETPLLTKALREKTERQRLAKVQNATLRVHFPKHILQFQCHPLETAGAILSYVQQQIDGDGAEIHLYVSPPKTILGTDTTLWESQLVPRGNARVGWSGGAEPQLKAVLLAGAKVLEPPVPKETAGSTAAEAHAANAATAAADEKPKPRQGYKPAGKGGGAQFLRLSKR